jgi:arabinogalactan oligomer/maltooligosaccharide transport system substrate-binding protein
MRSSMMAMAALAMTALPVGAMAATEVVVWHSYRGGEQAALEEVAKTFNGKNKDVQIKLLQIPYDAFADKITAAIPRGKGPDLFIFAQDRLGDWAANSLIEPVDFWLDDELRKAFVEPTLEALTYDDAVFGLPIAFKMTALIYNKKLVPTPPKTTGELIAMAKKATDAKAGRFGLVYENANFYFQSAWMQGFGGKVFDKKGKPTLDTPEVISSMKFAQKLAHESGIMPEEVSSILVTTLFNKGDAAFVINGPWFLGEIDKKVDYGVAVLPTIDEAGGKPARPFLTAEGIIMSAKSQDKKAAFEVMKYLASTEAGKVLATKGYITVARKAVYDDPAVKGNAKLMVFREQLKATLPMPNTPAMRMVWSPATTAMNKIINGKADPTPAMKEAQEEVAKLVKGARR